MSLTVENGVNSHTVLRARESDKSDEKKSDGVGKYYKFDNYVERKVKEIGVVKIHTSTFTSTFSKEEEVNSLFVAFNKRLKTNSILGEENRKTILGEEHRRAISVFFLQLKKES